MKTLCAMLFALGIVCLSSCKKKCECPEPDCLKPSLGNGLVAYYPFNGNAADESGYGNHPIFNNATLTTDRYNNPNKAYLFNGFNSYIRIPNSSSLNPDRITLAAIVKPMGFYQGKCHGNAILSKGLDVNLSSMYRISFDDMLYTNGQNCANSVVDSLHQNFYADFGANGAISGPYTPYVEKNKWFCLVYTFDGSTAKFYVDGNLVASKNTSKVYQPSSHDLFLGKMNDPLFPYWYNGAIDDLRIYNRAISEEETKSLCSTCNDK